MRAGWQEFAVNAGPALALQKILGELLNPKNLISHSAKSKKNFSIARSNEL
jgi:hypothetical protein